MGESEWGRRQGMENRVREMEIWMQKEMRKRVKVNVDSAAPIK